MIWPILFAIVAIVLAAYCYYIRELNTFKQHGIPYSKPIPILGSMASILLRLTSVAELAERAYQIHDRAKYVGTFNMASPVILLRDPEVIKTVIVKNFDHFPEHRAFSPMDVDPLFSKNLFSLRGDRWKEVRNILSPVFTTSKMKGMFKLMNECGKDFVGCLVQLPEKERSMDVKDAFTRYTSDVIATCAFGISLNSMADRNNAFYVYGREASNFAGVKALKFMLIQVMPGVAKLLGIKFVKDEISDFFLRLVGDNIKAREEQGIVRPDLIQQLMESKLKIELSLLDMTAQAFSFFIAGFDSTATTMCFAAHEVAVNPHVQEHLREEIDRVLEETKGELTYEALSSMSYLDAVVNETLRMYPMAVLGDRVCTKRYELPPTLPGAKPYVTEPGSYVWYSIYALQRDPKYFEEPHKFKPERFIENPKLVYSGAYLPFGVGPRMCIASRFALLEIKTLLFHLLARCDLRPCVNTNIPMRLSRSSITMTAENGFWLSIQPRSKAHPLLENAAASS